MKKVLKLEWKKDPRGYRLEERKGGHTADPCWDKTLLEGLTHPGGTFLVPQSGQRESYEHDFDKRQLISLQLLNAVSPQLDRPRDVVLGAVMSFANQWGMPNDHREAHVREFYSVVPEILLVLNLVAAERLRDAPGGAKLAVQMRDRLGTATPALPAAPERVASDGSAVHQLPKTLRHYCQLELWHAVETLNVPIGTCHYCRKLFARRINRGNRKDPHEFCPVTDGVRGKCGHDFNNQKNKLKEATSRTGSP
jgi:hypothetical protein